MIRGPRAAGAIALLIAGAILACGPAPAPTPVSSVSAEPAATPGTPVSAQNLTGTWLFGTQNEPSPGPVLGCYAFKLWKLEQTGSAVTGDVLACIGPCSAYTEGTQGVNTGGHLTLTGNERPSPSASPAPVTYDLTFDARTGHLTGTRNGAPFWAAPFVQRPRSECGPAPL